MQKGPTVAGLFHSHALLLRVGKKWVKPIPAALGNLSRSHLAKRCFRLAILVPVYRNI